MTTRTPTIDLYRDTEGRWRWRFVSSTGRVMADGGQSYSRRIDALHGAEVVTGGEYQPIEYEIEDGVTTVTEDPRIERPGLIYAKPGQPVVERLWIRETP